MSLYYLFELQITAARGQKKEIQSEMKDNFYNQCFQCWSKGKEQKKEQTLKKGKPITGVNLF